MLRTFLSWAWSYLKLLGILALYQSWLTVSSLCVTRHCPTRVFWTDLYHQAIWKRKLIDFYILQPSREESEKHRGPSLPASSDSHPHDMVATPWEEEAKENEQDGWIPPMASCLTVRNKKSHFYLCWPCNGLWSLPTSDVAKSEWWVSPSE